ncbi:hypothetical protein DD237_005437 [Peronospora effusa]|uniref:Uncharacterized protein n=1 Tax=Peronospora effusa TaxID=542832 RepID=A0A3R7VZ90_9STRA|nr:hypothetical protein DD237_005437 [Peronospora effusa]
MVERKRTLLPIYISGGSERRKIFAKRTIPSRTIDEASPVKKRKKFFQVKSRKWNVYWRLFLITFGIGMMCLIVLGFMVQNETMSKKKGSSGESSTQSFFATWKENQMLTKLERLSHMFTAPDDININNQKMRQTLSNLSDYECIGWRQTAKCTPLGEREDDNDKNCSAMIPNGVSGYCEVRNIRTKEVIQVLAMRCDSLRPAVHFSCNMFPSLLSYSILSTDYEHDSNFSFAHNQEVLRTTNQLSNTPKQSLENDGMSNETVEQFGMSFDRAIVFVIYESVLLGAYASVRSLRALGCMLPIEMWYKTSETNVEHPLLQLMVEELNVSLRVIDDPLATGFYTKLYAIFYSAFDNVLLLDADNFAVRDPNYLFDTHEFLETGAIFWPDFWKPSNTIFNVQKHSYVWEFFGLDYVDMFEQESGQVLINRRMHYKALNVLMYYGFSLPRTYETMQLVWGDKDLFRFAWLKSNSSFYMIPGPPGSAGTKHADYDLFCGVTMVQHDPSGRVLFLHRNTQKLTTDNNQLLWTHIQQFKRTSSLFDYKIRGANGGKAFPQFKRCFGKDVNYEKLFTLKPMSAFSFKNLETDLLRFATAGADVLRLSTYKERDVTSTHATQCKDKKDTKRRLGNGNRTYPKTMYGVFLFIVMSCTIGLISITSLVQYGDLQLPPRLAVHNLRSKNNQNNSMNVKKTPDYEIENEWVSSYECVGWKARRQCSPDGRPDPNHDRACHVIVRRGDSGFCELRHKITGHVRHVMKMHCNSLRVNVKFKCEEFASLLDYGRLATEYVHDLNFSLANCRQQLVDDQVRATIAMNEKIKQAQGDISDKDFQKEGQIALTRPSSYKRGITIVIYKKLLQSVYASVKSLRDMGCTLPIELWYKRSEVNVAHPLLRELTGRYGTYMREIRDPRAVRFFTKPYAIYYSAFDQVLFLDADNFAVRDPTYLFDTPQFQNKGAIFWPDFWHFKNSMFNIHSNSFVWEIFHLQPVDMFEQESGQVMIDRTVHQKALNVLMYYGFHPDIFLRLRLIWGDKDLYRFAWLKTNSVFHMIDTPPGSAGLKLADKSIFCGVTMAQHDLERDVLFLHRNHNKLSSDTYRKVWTHLQEFRMNEVHLDEYKVQGISGGQYFPSFKLCYGKDSHYENAFTVKAIDKLPFAGLEQRLLDLVQEAARIDGTRVSDIEGKKAVNATDKAKHQGA